jgi:hypothetical protein
MISQTFLQSIGPQSTLGTGIIMLSLTFKSTNLLLRTTVGVISGLLSRNQIEKIHGHELTILDVSDNTEISVRKADSISNISFYVIFCFGVIAYLFVYPVLMKDRIAL